MISFKNSQSIITQQTVYRIYYRMLIIENVSSTELRAEQKNDCYKNKDKITLDVGGLIKFISQ